MSNTNVSTEMKSLQMDVYGLPPEFLDSTERVNSLVEDVIARMPEMKVLDRTTYHFEPRGLTSLWLLSASHASVHTWPEAGFAALDLVTCGTSDLADIATVFEELFEEVDEDAIFQFSLTERGQGPDRGERRHVNDLAVQLMSLQQEKVPVYRGASKYQSIEVWDVSGRSWVDGSHFMTKRRLYLDGVLQLSTEDERLYHEALIHPAMTAHRGPVDVAILGGGDGCALDHALHHRSVKSATLVEIDEQVVEVAKEAFPACRNAWVDPRAEVVIADAFRWMADRASGRPASLDAVFFDLLDINVPSPLLDSIFAGDSLGEFVSHARRALRDDGFAVFQLGESGEDSGTPCLSVGGEEDNCVGELRQLAFEQELRRGFRSVIIYTQYVPSFLGNWVFALATDDLELSDRWNRSAAEIDADVAQRVYQHQSLSWFNGSSAKGLRILETLEPSLVVQRYQPAPPAPAVESCPGLERAQENSPLPGYEIPYMLAKSPHAHGIGVFTLRPIRRGEVIWRKHMESFRELTPENWRELIFGHPYAKEHGVKAFLERGWGNEYLEENEDGPAATKMFMELDDARFTNHGYLPSAQEAFRNMADVDGASASPQDYRYGRAIVATRDIDACEEILEDYQSEGRDSDLEEETTVETPSWWVEVLESYGLSDDFEFVPQTGRFLPEWALLSAPANSD